MKKSDQFNPVQIVAVNEAAAMAEELVHDFYKMSATQWRRLRFDIKTLIDLRPCEIVDGHFAQVLRYKGKQNKNNLGSSINDYYKICLQDHSILEALKISLDMKLHPFVLYIVTHELIHIVRFCKFLQSFDASDAEKLEEETRVHQCTHEILYDIRLEGLETVFQFHREWRRD